MEEQQQAIEKCLVPVVQAYYSDYNKSLSSLTAICDDFRQNQKEVIELSRRVDEVKTKMSGSHSGVKDLYYDKVRVWRCRCLVVVERVHSEVSEECGIYSSGTKDGRPAGVELSVPLLSLCYIVSFALVTSITRCLQC